MRAYRWKSISRYLNPVLTSLYVSFSAPNVVVGGSSSYQMMIRIRQRITRIKWTRFLVRVKMMKLIKTTTESMMRSLLNPVVVSGRFAPRHMPTIIVKPITKLLMISPLLINLLFNKWAMYGSNKSSSENRCPILSVWWPCFTFLSQTSILINFISYEVYEN